MQPGQQFSDWNAIKTDDGPGLLSMLAAYGVDKTGLKDVLNGVAPKGMGFDKGKFTYTPAVPPTNGNPIQGPSITTSELPPMNPYAAEPIGNGMLTPINHDAAAHEAFGLPAPEQSIEKVDTSAWENPSNGTGSVDKLKMLTSLFG